MRVVGSRIASAIVATAILFDSTVAVAATTPSTAAPPQTSAASWLTLSMLTPSGVIGLAGSAAQPAADQPPPPPPPPGPPPPQGNAVAGVPLPVIGIWLLEIAVAIYILTRNHRGRFVIPTPPVSPP